MSSLPSKSEELMKRFEDGKKKRDQLQEKWNKLEVAQKVASEKVQSLRKDLLDMGIDPDHVDEWLEKEELRLTKELDDFEKDAAKVDQSLKAIEEAVVKASSQV